MSDHPAEPGEGADDLFGRWLAHHEKPSEDGEARRPRRVPSAARPSEAATPHSRPSAASALADLKAMTIDKRDGLGALAPPSTFGQKRRGLPGSAHSGPGGEPDRNYDHGVAELDRQSPVGFEPIIIGSVRKKKEPEPEKEKSGRLKRLRSRVSGTHEDETTTVETVTDHHDEPGHFVPPPVFKAAPAASIPPPPVFETTTAAPEAPAERAPKQKRKIVAYEDMIALAMGAALPATEDVPVVELEADPDPDSGDDTEPEAGDEDLTPGSEAVPEPESVVEPVTEPESVLPDPELQDPPSPHPVLPEQQDDEVPPMAAIVVSPTPETTTTRRLVARPKTDEPQRRPVDARSRSSETTADAARGLLAAARAATPAPPAAAPVAPVVAEPIAAPAATAGTVDLAVPIAPPMEMPPVYEFAPLKGGRRLMSLLLLGGLVLSGYLGYGAYLSRETVEIGIAGVITLATLVIWGVRAGASVTRLTVRSGQLEIIRQGGRQVFDLSSHYTPIEVVGRAGSKKWKVMFVRRGMAPAIIDSSMVDSKEFMRILGFFRPELVNR